MILITLINPSVYTRHNGSGSGIKSDQIDECMCDHKTKQKLLKEYPKKGLSTDVEAHAPYQSLNSTNHNNPTSPTLRY